MNQIEENENLPPNDENIEEKDNLTDEPYDDQEPSEDNDEDDSVFENNPVEYPSNDRTQAWEEPKEPWKWS